MTGRMKPRFVTRIRGEFNASETLRAAVDRFYEDGEAPVDVHLHTTAQRIVPAHQFLNHTFDQYVIKAEERLAQPLARRALQLTHAPAPQIDVRQDGPIRIAFNAHPIGALRLITEALEEIPSWEPAQLRTDVLLELARAGLRSPIELEGAKKELLDALHDPPAHKALMVGGIRLSKTDIQNYPIRSNLFWPR